MLGDQVQGWYSVDERTPDVHRGEDEHEVGKHGVAHELAEAGRRLRAARATCRSAAATGDEAPATTPGPASAGDDGGDVR